METVDCNDNRNTILLHVFNVYLQVDNALLQSIQIFCRQFCLWNAAVILQCPNGCNQYDTIRLQTAVPTLDIKELFCTQIRTKSGFCYAVIAQLQGKLCCTQRVTAVCNICERAAVNECRRMCQCLHEIWFQGILQQGGHCTFCTQILCINWVTIQIISNQNLSQPPLHICQIRSQTENCHDF